MLRTWGKHAVQCVGSCPVLYPETQQPAGRDFPQKQANLGIISPILYGKHRVHQGEKPLMSDHSVPEGVSATLWGLVNRYSPTGEEAEAVHWLVQHMQRLGARRAFVDPVGNAVGIWGEGPREFVFLGHIDTVPGEIPVRVETREGRRVLYGRGSVDAKGPLAAMVDATAQTGPRPGWRVVVIGAVDEEGDSRGARYVANHYQPAYAVIGEPSRWHRVTLGYKGMARARLWVEQEQGHSAGPGGSAADRLLETWRRLREALEHFNRNRPRMFDQLQLTVRAMGTEEDPFRQRAWMHLAARLPRNLEPEGWYVWLQGHLPEEVHMERVGFPIPPYVAERDTPLVRAFRGAIRAQGARPGLVYKSGTADLNLVARVWGCPAVAYGPGDAALDHTPYEHLDLEEYEKGVAVLRAVLERLLV